MKKVADQRQWYTTLQTAVVEMAVVAVDMTEVEDHFTSMVVTVTLVHQKDLRAKTGSLAILLHQQEQLKVCNTKITKP